MDVSNLRKLIDEAVTEAITQWAAGASPDVSPEPSPVNEITEVKDEVPARVLPEGKRVVRTKSSGDRVYLLDDNKKTRQWVTSPEVLKGMGFVLDDVAEVDDAELLKFNMAAALYRVPEN